MNVNAMIITGITAIAFAFVCSVVGIKKRPVDFKLLCVFLGCTLFTELLAAYFAIKYRNNLAVYQVMGPIVMAGSSLYFNYSISDFKKYHIGYVGAALGVIFTIINLLFFEGIHKLNTNFAQLECLFNVCYCLFFFYKLMKIDQVVQTASNPYFWNAILFFIFYLCTFLSWGLIEYFKVKMKSSTHIVYLIVYILNIIFYTGLGLVFLILKPTKQKCEQYRV